MDSAGDSRVDGGATVGSATALMEASKGGHVAVVQVRLEGERGRPSFCTFKGHQLPCWEGGRGPAAAPYSSPLHRAQQGRAPPAQLTCQHSSSRSAQPPVAPQNVHGTDAPHGRRQSKPARLAGQHGFTLGGAMWKCRGGSSKCPLTPCARWLVPLSLVIPPRTSTHALSASARRCPPTPPPSPSTHPKLRPLFPFLRAPNRCSSPRGRMPG